MKPPWASPGLPIKVLGWLFRSDSFLRIQPKADVEMLCWLAQFLGNCAPASYMLNKTRMLRLARYSQLCLADLRSDTNVEYDAGAGGTLQLFRDARSFEASRKDIDVLRALGVEHELLAASGCIQAEPGLAASRVTIAGGLHLPDDETGDCHRFTVQLASLAAQLGVRFSWEKEIELRTTAGDGIYLHDGMKTYREFDRVVICLGCGSASAMANLGFRVPIYPIKGYSITFGIADLKAAPQSTILDDRYKVAITRLGARLRVGGLAELGGKLQTLSSRAPRLLERSSSELFGASIGEPITDLWSGLRPSTPDGTPIVGATLHPRVYCNSGHGTLGWTMACGSAKLTADLISGREPDIEAADLSALRYR